MTDVMKSLVRDPNSLPAPDSREQKMVMTAWRPDKLREMTYTQFWQLISERQIDKVSPSQGTKPARVTCMPLGHIPELNNMEHTPVLLKYAMVVRELRSFPLM